MKAIIVDTPGALPLLSADAPPPAPDAGEILVRVQASSVNPVDNAIAEGTLTDLFEHEFPITLGRDFAGTVEQTGPQVRDVSAGEEVFGFLPAARPVVHDGAWAELVVVPDSSVVCTPEGIDLAAAGAAPLAAVTAITAIDALALAPGDTVLIVGATGGVGSFAVQLAATAGASVITPALPEDAPYLRGLGASELLPRNADLVGAVRERHPGGVDALLDNVSREPGRYDSALSDGARVASPNRAAGDGPGRTDVQGIPSRENLERLAELLGTGTIMVPIQGIYPLEQAAEAMLALCLTHTHGKLALEHASDGAGVPAVASNDQEEPSG